MISPRRIPPMHPRRQPNPFVQYAADLGEAAARLRQATNKEQAIDCLRSIRHFLEVAEEAIK